MCNSYFLPPKPAGTGFGNGQVYVLYLFSVFRPLTFLATWIEILVKIRMTLNNECFWYPNWDLNFRPNLYIYYEDINYL